MQQAEALLAACDNPEPPLFDEALATLPGIEVRRWRWLPEPALLLADGRRWLILVSSDLDGRERSLHVLQQVKRLLDMPDRVPGSCEDEQISNCRRFAMNVLVPTSRLRLDLASGSRNAEVLARRYGVPTSAMRQRIDQLRLVEGESAMKGGGV